MGDVSEDWAARHTTESWPYGPELHDVGPVLLGAKRLLLGFCSSPFSRQLRRLNCLMLDFFIRCALAPSMSLRRGSIAPAVVVVLISLAYIEEDGLLLCLAFLFAVILVSIASVAVWGTIFSALLISDI
jgi:hypothetical protein